MSNYKAMAKELAEKMYLSANTMEVNGWPGDSVTFFYLDTEDHMLYSGTRGFGMKVSIKHPTGWGLGIDELEHEILCRIKLEA